ncbi:TlpA family protein disulfide reductase [Myxococcota bacterium]|nr:TlpA family protein disulfide reductase [Myxococcota bacterium]
MTLLALALSLALCSPATPPEARKAAPDFELKDLAGKRVKLSSLAGKVVVVNFWATWCKPCLLEMPHLGKLEAELGEQGLVVLSISTDSPQTLAEVRQLVRRERFTQRILLDPEGKVLASLNPRGTNPFTVVVDRAGRIAEVHEGYTPGDERKYREWAEALLKEPSKG